MNRGDNIFAGDIPGTDAILKLSEDAINAIQVTNIKPIDVSYIKDSGVRAIVALAASCDWNVVHRAGQMVTLISRTGHKLRFPTNTSIKFSVFASWTNGIARHSLTHLPTPELMEKLIAQYKLDTSHARVFREAVGKPEPIELEEPSAAALDEFVPTERVEPTLNTAAKGLQYVSQIMETVIRQLVPEGEDQITYRCLVCGLEFPTKRGVGGHYGNHVAKGEAVAKPEARDNAIRVTPTLTNQIGHNHPASAGPDPDNCAACSIGDQPGEPEPEPMTDEEWEPFIEAVQEPVFDDELTRLRDIISQVAALVSGDVARERDEALAELQDLRQRFNALQQTLSTLYELLGELNQTNKEK